MLMNKTGLMFYVAMMLAAFDLPAQETWKITSANWEPYSGVELINHGQSINKLKELLKKADIKLIVEFYPWNRAKKIVENNSDYVGIFPAWPEDVFENAIISAAVDWSEISVLRRFDTQVSFSSIDELFKKYSVGIVISYIYPKVVNEAINKYPQHVDGSSNEIALLRKLSTGRDQVAITDPKVMLYLAQQQGINNVEVVEKIMNKALVVAFRDDEENKKRLTLLNKLLHESEN